jgi:hypothetical protein
LEFGILDPNVLMNCYLNNTNINIKSRIILAFRYPVSGCLDISGLNGRYLISPGY